MRTVTTHAQRFVRRRLSKAQRLSGRFSGIVRGFPIVVALVLILVAVLVAAAIVRWPSVVFIRAPMDRTWALLCVRASSASSTL